MHMDIACVLCDYYDLKIYTVYMKFHLINQISRPLPASALKSFHSICSFAHAIQICLWLDLLYIFMYCIYIVYAVAIQIRCVLIISTRCNAEYGNFLLATISSVYSFTYQEVAFFIAFPFPFIKNWTVFTAQNSYISHVMIYNTFIQGKALTSDVVNIEYIQQRDYNYVYITHILFLLLGHQ